MQVDGAVRGGSTGPQRSRLNVVAIVVIAAMVALVVWAGALATSDVGAEDANAGAGMAGSAVIHDDPWNLPHSNAGSAVIHDDAGHVNRD